MIESSEVGLCAPTETGRWGFVFLDGDTEMSNHVKEVVPRSLRKTFLGCKMFTDHHGREGTHSPSKVDGQRIRRSRKSVWNKLGDWDLYLHTVIFKVDN